MAVTICGAMVLPRPRQPRTLRFRAVDGSVPKPSGSRSSQCLQGQAVVTDRRCPWPPWSVPASRPYVLLGMWLWVLRVKELEYFACMFLDHSAFGLHERACSALLPTFQLALWLLPPHVRHFNMFWMLTLCHVCIEDLLIPVIFLLCHFDVLKILI